MRLKYYLRGFGTGVIFATLILMVAFQMNQNLTPSNSQKQEERTSENIASDDSSTSDIMVSDSASSDDAITEKVTTEATNESTSDEETTQEDVSSEEVSAEETSQVEMSQEETTQVENFSEEISSQETVPQETTPQEPEQQESIPGELTSTSGETAVLVITAGMTSIRATEILEELGVIEDAVDYNLFLHNNGYSSRLRVGTYEIRKGASYEEITQMIVRH